MFKNWLAPRMFLSALVALLALIPFNVASAQGTPVQQVTTLLAQQGYAALAVANFPDEQGNPRPDTMYVLMNAANRNLDSQEIAVQALWGFAALRQYYPNATVLLSILKDRQFLVMFGTESSALDAFLNEQVNAGDYWRGVRGRVQIFNSQTNSVVTEQEFASGGQTNKNFTNQNFTQQQPACPAPSGKARLYVQNNYMGKVMRFTIGGQEWGTHDYDIQGDGQRHFVDMPPGTYTYTAFIPGEGTAHGERTGYEPNKCYYLTFGPQ